MTDQFTCTPAPPERTHPCSECGRMFYNRRAANAHARAKHNPLGNVTSGDRPHYRGQHACGQPGCRYSFATVHGARQHRRDKHGIVEP